MSIEQKLSEDHAGDSRQLEVVFSNEKKLLIEAPAGYGKTKTMVSKIAYLLATNQIPYPKRILTLTFSVNAAYKIKKDVAQNIPKLLAGVDSNINVSEKMFVSNYHGFARRILKRYGYKLHPLLINIDTFQSLDDSDPKQVMQSISGISYEMATLFSNFNDAVKKVNHKFIEENIDKYNRAVIDNFLHLRVIPYNAILSLAIKVLSDYSVVREFYQRLFRTVIVDEYQDTNTLSYALLSLLFHEKTNIILMGDTLQRIYGFIGAIPNLLSMSEAHLGLKKIQLDKNYRFQSNQQMLLLDGNIRRNAETPQAPKVKDTAKIDFTLLNSQVEEANFLIDKSVSLVEKYPSSKVAILVKQRSNNSNIIIEEFNKRKVSFFYGLFTDEDPNYIKFNRESLFELVELLRANGTVTKKMLNNLQTKLRAKITATDALTISLFKLLGIFLGKVFTEFSFLANEERITLLKDTFENNGLKQYVEFIDTNIIITTIHGAKGLEWDYVLIPDMEAYAFPNYWGLCGNCGCQSNCDLKVTSQIESKFLEELSVFYVAVTRARKQVYFSASKTQIDSKGNEVKRNLSCFLKLPGIQV
jgi:DNA helicase-2/ATP-dependent DNA helicase PcrA